MRTFGFLVTDLRGATPVVSMAKQAIEAMTGKAVHDMLHRVAQQWEQENKIDVEHKCGMVDSTNMFVEVIEGGRVLCRVESHEIEMYQDNDPISGLVALLAGAAAGIMDPTIVSADNIGSLPDELKQALATVHDDPSAPQELKDMLTGAGITGAPKNKSLH